MTLFLYAPNVKSGGGAVLARALLKEIEKQKTPTCLFIDERYSEEVPSHVEVIRVAPTIWKRLKAEFQLKSKVQQGDLVFNFGNLPPLQKLPAKTVVYLHNRNLLPGVDISNFPFKARLRQQLEALWIRLFATNADYFAVQTQSMKDAFEKVSNVPCRILPFVPDEVLNLRKSTLPPKYDFLYVASGDPHKNHGKLLEAWELLSQKGIYPSLALTLPKTAEDLLSRLKVLCQNPKINIHNHPDLAREEILKLYGQSRAFIFPSLQESFGIPLIEATQAELPLLVSNLPYAHDLVTASAYFDPYSASAIAMSVEKFINSGNVVPSLLIAKVLGSAELLKQL